MNYDERPDIDLHNHKLVIVMDHSPYFTTSSDPNKWLDSFCQDVVPIIPKSLWACMVESIMEFTRIVWNIFPKDNLIEIIACNHMAHILNNWEVDTQCTEYLAGAFSTLGPPVGETPPGYEASILHGLRGAMESLIDYTPLQKLKFFDDLACMAKTEYAKLNQGRIICITSLSTELDLKVLTDLFLNEMGKYNYSAAHSDFQQLPVTDCHLIIINIYPTDTPCEIMDQPPHQVAADLKVELHTIDAMHLSDKLSQLLVLKYNLMCMVIDDIPNLNFGENDNLYNAEMFHLKDINLDIASEYPDAIREVRLQDSLYSKMCLRWSYQHLEVTDIITSMTRITPADIKSPGAARLVKHLYMGQKVLLEYQINDISVIKYMLAVQEGDIFLHTLLIPREIPILVEEQTKSPRDDGDIKTKSSDTETVQSLDDVEKSCTLSKSSDNETTAESDSTKFYKSNTDSDEICSNDEYLPIVHSDNDANENVLPLKQSILYSPYVKQLLFNFLSSFMRIRLTRNQIEMCCHSIGAIKSNEINNFSLNLPDDNIYKTAPKVIQYQVLWNELQQFIENNIYSSEHESIYNFFREVIRGETIKSAVYEQQTPISQENESKLESSPANEDPIEDTARRLSLLDFLVKKADKTQRNLKDERRAKKNKK